MANKKKNNSNAKVVQRFKDAIQALEGQGEKALPMLRDLYHKQIEFQDPMQSVVGIEPFIEANRRLVKRAKSLSFKLETVVEQDGNLFVVWTLMLKPMVGPAMTVEGTTHAIIRDGLIVYQRDYWDLLSSIANAIPGVGMVYRRLVSLFA
jgi:hypothetical protein